MGTASFPRKILVPVDGSALDHAAARTAATLAKAKGASVTIVHVIRSMQEYFRMKAAAEALKQGIPQPTVKKILEQSTHDAKIIMNSAKTAFDQERVSVCTEMIREIDPADGILKMAGQEYDLIIMGAHGKDVKDPYMLGSTTKRVVRHAAAPTLIVKNECSFSNLLVCVDGSENSIEALKHATNLVAESNSKITLLNVQEPRLFVVSRAAAKELGEQILAHARSCVEGNKLAVESLLEFGPPSDCIAELAQRRDHDLIVMGSRGLGPAKRFLLGSVSDKVSHRAKCSVLIVPNKL